MGCEMSSNTRSTLRPPATPTLEQSPAKLPTTRSHPRVQEALQQSFEEGDYAFLLVLLSDSTPEEVTEPFPKWAEPPQTLGCAALAVLNRQFRHGTVLFAPGSLMQCRDLILASLEQSRTALSQHILYFCYKLGKQGDVAFLQELANNGLFQSLFKLLTRPRPIFFLYTMKLVALMLENSPQAKPQFVEAGGVEKCLHIMRGTRGRGLGFVDTLRAFLALIRRPGGGIEAKYAEPILAGFKEIDIDQLQLHSLNTSQRHIFNKFIQKLLDAKTAYDDSTSLSTPPHSR